MKEIVIKIDDEIYNSIVNMDEFLYYGTFKHLLEAVQNGKVLPKGHRGLKDVATIVDKIIDTDIYLTDEDWAELGKALKSAETLVEADKEYEVDE